jgi:hypothetical protein
MFAKAKAAAAAAANAAASSANAAASQASAAANKAAKMASSSTSKAASVKGDEVSPTNYEDSTQQPTGADASAASAAAAEPAVAGMIDLGDLLLGGAPTEAPLQSGGPSSSSEMASTEDGLLNISLGPPEGEGDAPTATTTTATAAPAPAPVVAASTKTTAAPPQGDGKVGRCKLNPVGP